MSKSIYDQHDKHFDNVSAFVVLKDGACVARVAFKYPRDGAGRLYAYVHWLCLPMVRGDASGYGYDKRSTAVSNAAKKLNPSDTLNANALISAYAFVEVISKNEGRYWDNGLSDAGFTVVRAV